MSIFHTDEFCKLHGMTLYGGIIPFGYNAGKFCSPTVGTFGGFSSGTVSDMEEAISYVNSTRYAVRSFNVSLAPSSHGQKNFARSVNIFTRAKYRVVYADINYDVMVDRPLVEKMSDGHRKKLAKCEYGLLICHQLYRKEWRYAHEIISSDRERKGLKLSMSFDQLEAQEKALPGTTVCFGVTSPTGIKAAAICIRIKPDVLYVYAWGDTGKSEYAPTIMLANHIYEYCRDQGIAMMDIGIATLKGVPNHGLMAFKRNLGFSESIKLTMRKA